jgi:hypothetical protein
MTTAHCNISHAFADKVLYSTNRLWQDRIVPRISRMFLMLAVAGLWIEHHTRWRAAGYSFLQLYRQALRGLTMLNCSSSDGIATALKKLAARESLQLGPSRGCDAYERRELRMRW